MYKHIAFISASILIAGSSFASQIVGTSGFGLPTVPGATSTIDFDSQSDATFGTLTLGGVTFSGIGGNLRTDNSFPNQYNGRGARYLDNNVGSTSGIRFDFATTLSAFAFNWGASDYQWTLAAYDASNTLIESFNVPITHGSNAGDYIGLANSGMAYATLTTGQGADWVIVDNFTIAESGSTVPEPVSLALVSLGLVGLGVTRRKHFAAV